MLYELRVYEAIPGKLAALNSHLEAALPLFKKHGLGVLGFWTGEIGAGGEVTYIWEYESMADREKKFPAFAADPAWREQVAKENAEVGVITARTHSTIMRLTPYSPEPRITTEVQELRVYDAVPGRLPDLNNRFANHAIRIFERQGMTNIGYWTVDVGTSNQLIYMLGYPSLGDREKSWAAFRLDPEWLKAVEESETNGPIVEKVHASILRPTPYSPRS